MEYKIETTGERRIIKLIIVALIIVLIVGAYIYFFNNPKYIFKYNAQKLNNELVTFLSTELNSIKPYTNNYTSILKVKEENSEKEGIEVYVNKNEDNEYNIIKLNDIISIYEKEGIYYIYTNGTDYLTQINNEKIPIDFNKSIESLNTEDLAIVYKKFSNTFINKLEDKDFYKLSYTYKNEKGKERKAYRYGLSISETRLKEILLETFKDIQQDNKIMIKLDGIIKEVNQNATSEEFMEYCIKTTEEYVARDYLTIDLLAETAGNVKESISNIEFLIKENANIIYQMSVNTSNNTINMNVIDINKSIENTIMMKKENNGYTFSIDKKEKNELIYSSSISIQNYSEFDNISYIYNGNDIVVKVNYKTEKENLEVDKTLTSTGNINIKLQEKEIEYIINNIITFEKKTEDVPYMKIQSFDEEIENKILNGSWVNGIMENSIFKNQEENKEENAEIKDIKQ